MDWFTSMTAAPELTLPVDGTPTDGAPVIDAPTDEATAPAAATVRAQDAALGVTFADLALPPALERAVADLGFTVPSAIQAEAIPALLSG